MAAACVSRSAFGYASRISISVNGKSSSGTVKAPKTGHLSFLRQSPSRSADSSAAESININKTCNRVSVPSTYRTPWSVNSPALPINGFGSTCSPPPPFRSIPDLVSVADITSVPTRCKKPFEPQRNLLISTNGLPHTPSATPSQHTYWRMATTSARCRICSVTRTLRRR